MQSVPMGLHGPWRTAEDGEDETLMDVLCYEIVDGVEVVSVETPVD